ncbi:hypothetical protein PHYC_00962 [Phycisphaerales bacterium]|nr:hypothetical protein PHYC_00962 [Phycisphaerales bacterium]
MKCACSRGFLSSGIAVLGLVGLGFGGYNVITTGCPLGSCHKGDSAITTVSTTPPADAATCPFSSKDTTAAECPHSNSCCAEGDKALASDPSAKCPVHTQAQATEPAKDPA